MEAWPPLRRDLQFHRAPESHPSEPLWVLYDPLRALYIELGELEILMLQRWHLGSAQAIAENLARERGVATSEKQVRDFGRFAEDNDLLQGDAASLQKRLATKPRPPLQSLQKTLFWRRPLFSPDKIARALSPLARLTLRRYFWLGVFCTALLAALSISQHWLDFLQHLRASWNPLGIASLAACFILLSLFHELGHCSVARLYHIRANSLGVGLIALMPIMYSEITDAWRLPKSARLHISAAGLAFELLVAVASALAWCLLENGVLRSLCFYLFTASLITTFVINLNPLMRFDGYYLLSDITGEKNLHSSSASALRTSVWNLFLRRPAARRGRRQHLLTAFGLFSLIYRTGVFLAISWAVYQLLFKAAGAVAFALCIALLLVWPAAREISAFVRYLRQEEGAKEEGRKQEGGKTGAERSPMKIFSRLRPAPVYTLLFLLALFLIPLPWPVQLPAATFFPQQQKVVAPAGGIIEHITVQRGSRVSAGDTLLQLDSRELDYRIERSRLELALLTARKSRDGFEETLDSLDGVYLQDLLSKQQELRSLQAQRQQLRITAKISGNVDWRLPGIGAGEYLSVNQQILSIVNRAQLRGRAYGRAQLIERIATGQSGRLFLSGHWQPLPVTVENIDLIGSHQLQDPTLSGAHGGPLATEESRADRTREALHKVLFALPENSAQKLAGQRPGHLVLFGEPVSLFQLSFRRIAGVFVRESGL